MNTKDIIKEKYKVARKYYETYKHTTECSYYLGYMDALGELLERIEQEEEKEIPEKLIPTSLKDIDDLNEKIEVAHIDTISAIGTINEIIDYLKSKGDE